MIGGMEQLKELSNGRDAEDRVPEVHVWRSLGGCQMMVRMMKLHAHCRLLTLGHKRPQRRHTSQAIAPYSWHSSHCDTSLKVSGHSCYSGMVNPLSLSKGRR